MGSSGVEELRLIKIAWLPICERSACFNYLFLLTASLRPQNFRDLELFKWNLSLSPINLYSGINYSLFNNCFVLVTASVNSMYDDGFNVQFFSTSCNCIENIGSHCLLLIRTAHGVILRRMFTGCKLTDARIQDLTDWGCQP